MVKKGRKEERETENSTRAYLSRTSHIENGGPAIATAVQTLFRKQPEVDPVNKLAAIVVTLDLALGSVVITGNS